MTEKTRADAIEAVIGMSKLEWRSEYSLDFIIAAA